jgi:hypothetical protein
MRQDRVGIPRFVYGLLVVAFVLRPFVAASCSGSDSKKTTTSRNKGTTTTRKATSTTNGTSTTKGTTTTKR